MRKGEMAEWVMVVKQRVVGEDWQLSRRCLTRCFVELVERLAASKMKSWTLLTTCRLPPFVVSFAHTFNNTPRLTATSPPSPLPNNNLFAFTPELTLTVANYAFCSRANKLGYKRGALCERTSSSHSVSLLIRHPSCPVSPWRLK